MTPTIAHNLAKSTSLSCHSPLTAYALPGANPFYLAGTPVPGFYPDYDLSDNWAYGI